MRPRHTAAALALLGALAVATALSGCSGNSGGQPGGKIGGVGAGASTGTGGAGGSGGAGASSGPSISASIPADLTLDVVMTPTGDPSKDGLLNSTKSLLYASEQAVAKSNANDPLYQSMVSGTAGSNLYAMVQSFVQTGQRPTGTLRFYDFTTKTSKLAADVLFCEDTSAVVPLTVSSGATSAPVTGSAALIYWDVGFLLDSGKPAISYVSTQPGGDICAQD